jgi:hypothetical protein
MIDKCIIEEIDRIIKEIWVKEIPKDYHNAYLLKEASLKCSLYFHLRTKLKKILEENNLRIYTEYYFHNLNYNADIAIVQVDDSIEKIRDKVVDVIAVMELKYDGGNSIGTANAIKYDLHKIKNCIQSGKLCQYYFGVIYQTECICLNWLDKRSTNNWAKGYVTELNAGGINGCIVFEVNSYNGMNT